MLLENTMETDRDHSSQMQQITEAHDQIYQIVNN